MSMLRRTGSAVANPHRRRLRAVFAGLMVAVAARSGLAEEPAAVPPAKIPGRISVERIEPPETSGVSGQSDPAARNSHEARVGDRVAIRLMDVRDVKDKPVVVSFTNKEATYDVGWARWAKDENQNTDDASLRVTVPQRVLVDPRKPEWVSVEVRVDGKALTGRAGIHVFPHTRITLETINGNRAKSDPPAAIEWTHQVRVAGSGFVAPEGRIEFTVDDVLFPVQDVDPEGRSFVVQLPQNCDEYKQGARHIGTRRVTLRVWDDEVDLGGFDTVQAEDANGLTVGNKWRAAGVAAIPLLVLMAFLGLACREVQSNRNYDASMHARKRPTYLGSFEVLLLDPATNTYSLSRFQFLWWLGIVLFSYSYLFFARGWYVAQDWRFYDLAGSSYPLLISLGTLVGATWTTKIVGQKGSGDDHPGLTDLVVHGGVVSLDRVQQLAISLIAGVMFAWIVWRTAPTSAALPDVPEKILTLMGFSSAGYLGGKFARKPGPMVDHADVADAAPAKGTETGKPQDPAVVATGKVLRIWGANFAAGAEVFVNQKRVDPEAVVPEARSAGGAGFSDVLRIALAKLPSEIRDAKLASVVVVNGDAQEARWAAPVDEKESSL
jgi:hypothetical protein